MCKMDPMSGCDIRPETVHCSTKDAYTSEITIFALLYFVHVTVSQEDTNLQWFS